MASSFFSLTLPFIGWIPSFVSAAVLAVTSIWVPRPHSAAHRVKPSLSLHCSGQHYLPPAPTEWICYHKPRNSSSELTPVLSSPLLSSRRTVFLMSLNQPGTSIRQQYTPLSPWLEFVMVKDTSPRQTIPKSAYLVDFLEIIFVPSVWTSSSLHLELGHAPLPQHMLLRCRDQDGWRQGKVTDWPKTPVIVSCEAAGAVEKVGKLLHRWKSVEYTLPFVYKQRLPGRRGRVPSSFSTMLTRLPVLPGI